MSYWVERPAAQREESLKYTGPLETLQSACYEVARDMGLAAAKPTSDPASLVFQASFDWPPVQVVVHLPDRSGKAEVRMVASARMRNDERAREYAHRVVEVFATRLEAELVPRLTTSRETWKRGRQRRTHRTVLGLLKAAQWAWLGVLLVLVLVQLKLKGSPIAFPYNLLVILFYWLAALAAPVAAVARKRLVGTGSEVGDRVILAVVAGLGVLITLSYVPGCQA
jgi:hypothetical protein